jgi:hypothetical protein
VTAGIAETVVDKLIRENEVGVRDILGRIRGRWSGNIKEVWSKLPKDGTDHWFKAISDPHIDFDRFVGPVNPEDPDGDYVIVLATLEFKEEEGRKPSIFVRTYIYRPLGISGDSFTDYDSEEEVPEELRQRGLDMWNDYYQKYVYPALTKSLLGT